MSTTEKIWLFTGFAGQSLFAMRFLLQWIKSEKEKKSVIPVAFWYFSLLGGLVLLSYSFYIKDPVFIAGQSMGILIYLRNLYFIRNTRKAL